MSEFYKQNKKTSNCLHQNDLKLLSPVYLSVYGALFQVFLPPLLLSSSSLMAELLGFIFLCSVAHVKPGKESELPAGAGAHLFAPPPIPAPRAHDLVCACPCSRFIGARDAFTASASESKHCR